MRRVSRVASTLPTERRGGAASPRLCWWFVVSAAVVFWAHRTIYGARSASRRGRSHGTCVVLLLFVVWENPLLLMHNARGLACLLLPSYAQISAPPRRSADVSVAVCVCVRVRLLRSLAIRRPQYGSPVVVWKEQENMEKTRKGAKWRNKKGGESICRVVGWFR